LEFFGEVKRAETRVMRLFSSEDRMHDRSWSRFGMIPVTVTDGRSDGQTDGQTESIMANTALCIASYADALSTVLVNDIALQV